MKCISIAIFPEGTGATVKRVVEYFYPGQGQGKIWVDIFVENPSSQNLTMKVLHAGSLCAEDVTEDSWVRERAEKDHCAAALTKRIRDLHVTYCPISLNRPARSVQLGSEEYQAWRGGLAKVIGDDPSMDVPFTLWQIEPVLRGTRTVLRLRLEMRDPTYEQRFADKGSFFAYGEAIVLGNIENALRSYNETDADTYKQEFANFKSGHKVPESFEYLIVAPDGPGLRWDAVALSGLISPQFIRDGRLARTTKWFATDNPYIDDWQLRSNFVLTVTKLDDVRQTPTQEAEEALAFSLGNGQRHAATR